MSLSAPFIRRPVATTLITVAIALAGAIAYTELPVSPLPQVDYPTISINASLPGGSADIMASAVATPLERQLGHIAGVVEMTSQSTLGNTQITVQFDLSRNIDGAARDVEAALNAARTYLPANLPSNPSYRKVNPSDAPIMILGLTSDIYDAGKLYDEASTVIQQKLSQVKGVGQVSPGGGALPSVRVDVNPTKLANYGLSMSDVKSKLSLENSDAAEGQITNGDVTMDIVGNGQITKAEDYKPLIIGYSNGSAVRLSDVADVTDSVSNIRAGGYLNGKRAVNVIIYRQPGANIIATVDRLKAELDSVRASIPAGINLTLVMDRTTTIRASVNDVEMTLAFAVMLVILVVFLFLRNARSTLIPAVAVPVSLIGTCAVMYLCGYSLDNLSLMALTISTGFVVDDAIVVMENITRHMEGGMTPMAAAFKGAQEIGFTVFSISMSLIAVFIPILMMGGYVGRLFREFAVTLSTAILVSMVISLTTTPTMCAHLLKNESKKQHGRIYMLSERFFDGMMAIYKRSLVWFLDRPFFTLSLLGFTIALTATLYLTLPRGFFPSQDTGVIVSSVQGPQDASYSAMLAAVKQIAKVINSDPAVANAVAFTGGRGGTNSGFIYVVLKPLSVRKVSVIDVIGRLRPKLAPITGASAFPNPQQDIHVGGRSSQALYQYTLQADSGKELAEWGPKLLAAMKKLPGFEDVNSDQQNGGLDELLTYDRSSAAKLGLTASSLDSALYSAFGQEEVSVIYSQLNQYYVVLEVAPQYWQSPDGLNDTYLSSSKNTAIPIFAVAKSQASSIPLEINHTGLFPSVTLSFNLAAGLSLSYADDQINKMMQDVGAPTSIHGFFAGTAQAFKDTWKTLPWLIITAALAVYIVLGILYENLVHPITIMTTLLPASAGALLGLWLYNFIDRNPNNRMELDVISIIGIILLIGIVKKNAIMMIDFALQAERNEGKGPADAIFQACLLRFRPIMMTTMAAMFGALPLALGTGTGSELRRPLGVSIVGGLIVSQLLTLYTTPVIYLLFDRLRLWFKGEKADIFHHGEEPVPADAQPFRQ